MELHYTVGQHTQRLYEIVAQLLKANLKHIQWNDHCGTGYLSQSETPGDWTAEFQMNRRVLAQAGLNPMDVSGDLIKVFQASYQVKQSNHNEHLVFIRFRLNGN